MRTMNYFKRFTWFLHLNYRKVAISRMVPKVVPHLEIEKSRKLSPLLGPKFSSLVKLDICLLIYIMIDVGRKKPGN